MALYDLQRDGEPRLAHKYKNVPIKCMFCRDCGGNIIKCKILVLKEGENLK